MPEVLLPLQVLKNTGSTAITVPYTLAIYSPNYALITGSAWNWGASGSANGGTLSGPVTQVTPHISSYADSVHCALFPPTKALERVRVAASMRTHTYMCALADCVSWPAHLFRMPSAWQALTGGPTLLLMWVVLLTCSHGSPWLRTAAR